MKDVEEYYRCSIDQDINTWNIRDRHMFKVLQRLVQRSKELNRSSKIIVWAHNSHVNFNEEIDHRWGMQDRLIWGNCVLR